MMRLWFCFPLFALFLVSSASQISSVTLVDALSADPDYTSIIRLLQRARLIPTLNRLNGSTFFAPTNDAIERHISKYPLFHAALHDQDLDQQTLGIYDNVADRLRQQLFYHLLNYTLPAIPTDSNPEVHKTLLFPREFIEPPIPEPPSTPPWMPVPGGTLGGEPQRLRISSSDGAVWVGVDAFGGGGAQVVKSPVDAGNGLLLGISEVLDMPPDLSTVVSQHTSTSYFHKILTPEIVELLNTTSELTLFLPVDEAWLKLHPMERLYLESPFATDDLSRILNAHAVVEKDVKWSDSFEPALNLTTLDGTKLEIVASKQKTMVANAELVRPDIYASNGVLHLVTSLLMSPKSLKLTPEKYLLALNCTSFVSMIHSVDLTSLINDTEAKYTILAPRDEVLSLFGGDELPERGTEELRTLLQYHFLPGKWLPKKLKDGMLVETALEEPGLAGRKQVLGVEVHDENKKPTPGRRITFAGAGVLDDPIEINNTLIYFVSRPLVPPSDSLQAALPFLDLSSFLAAIFSTSLGGKLKTHPRTTLLVPHNSAFKQVGMLISEHLLSASSKADLEKVILHHTIDGVEYAQAIRNGSQRSFPTLEGSDISFERLTDGSVFTSGSGGWGGMKSEVYTKDLLTRTGVVHELSDLLLPRTVDLTVGKLMKAAKGSTMANLMMKAGMDWLLNGTAPPEGSLWADEGLDGGGWTVLCPTDDAFKEVNLTTLYRDTDGVREIVRQHLIPKTRAEDMDVGALGILNNNRPLPFDGSPTFSTLLTKWSSYADIVFQKVEEGYVVGIKGARGTDGKADWARVMSWGRSTTGGGTGGVIQISRLLFPYRPPWWIMYGGPAVVGVLGVLCICAFFHGVRIVWRMDTTEATYEPVGGFGRDD